MKNFHGFKPNHKMSHGGDLGGDGRKHQRIETMKYAKGGNVSSDRAAIAHQKNVATRAAITGQMAARKGMNQQTRRFAEGGSTTDAAMTSRKERSAAQKERHDAKMAAQKEFGAARRAKNQAGRQRRAEAQAAKKARQATMTPAEIAAKRAATMKRFSEARAAKRDAKNAAYESAIQSEMKNLARGGMASQKNFAKRAEIMGQMAAHKGMNQQTRRFAEGGSTSSMSSQASSSTMTDKQKKEAEKAAKKAAEEKEKDAKHAADKKKQEEKKAERQKYQEAKRIVDKKEKDAEKAAKEKERAAKKADKNKPKTTTSSTSSTSSTPATTTTSPAANTAASNVSASPTTTSAKASEGISYAYVPNTAAEKLGAAVMGRQLKKGGKVLKKANGGMIAGKMPVDPYGPRGGRPAPSISPGGRPIRNQGINDAAISGGQWPRRGKPRLGGPQVDYMPNRNPPALGQLDIPPTRFKKGGAAKGGKWIQGAIKKPGSLHKSLGVPMGEKIPAGKLEKASHAAGKLGKRARFAMTLKGMK